MTDSMQRRSLAAAPLALTMMLSGFVGVTAAHAQAPAPAPHHKNLIQKHPYATGFAAGLTTHHALKVAAARDKARGKKLNWAERHPTLSAIGVGGVTTHEIKKHTAP